MLSDYLTLIIDASTFGFKKGQWRQNSSVKIQTEVTALQGNGTIYQTKLDEIALQILLVSSKGYIETKVTFGQVYFLRYNDTEAIALPESRLNL